MSSRTHAVIIANGTLPHRAIVAEFLPPARLIICADGGANHARRLGIRPNVIIGDFDSITRTTRRAFPDAIYLPSGDQYSTDLEKALEYCLEHNLASVDILGATGTRIDHATGGLGCFKKYGRRISMRIVDTVGVVSLIRRSVEFEAAVGEKVSLIPLDRCEGITTTNLLYSLKNDYLELGLREGISNQATGERVKITVRKGTLLLYRFFW